MSITPRTDAEATKGNPTDAGRGYLVTADFARQLERELNELNEWKAGMKGVEEFYAMRHQRDEWRKCAEMNNAALQGCLKRYRIAMAEMLQATAPIFAPKEPSPIENLKAVSAAFDEFIRLASKP